LLARKGCRTSDTQDYLYSYIGKNQKYPGVDTASKILLPPSSRSHSSDICFMPFFVLHNWEALNLDSLITYLIFEFGFSLKIWFFPMLVE